MTNPNPNHPLRDTDKAAQKRDTPQDGNVRNMADTSKNPADVKSTTDLADAQSTKPVAQDTGKSTR